MIFWGIVAPDVGVATIGYPKAMLVTIALWLVVGPLVRRGGGKKGGDDGKFAFFKSAARERNKGSNGGKPKEQTVTSDDLINVSSTFGGASCKATSQSFRGGEIETSFGGVQLDLREARLHPDGAILKVKALIGGIEIQVPKGWDVELDITSSIAGSNDNRTSSADEGAPKLKITGTATLAGVTVKD